MRLVLAAAWLLFAVAPAGAHDERPPEEARARMQHHLAEVQQLAEHFDGVMSADCPRFASPREWSTYLDGEIDRVVLLVAHLEQAWYEATRTGDDDVRRTAKAPRRRLEQARSLVMQKVLAQYHAIQAAKITVEKAEIDVTRLQEAAAKGGASARELDAARSALIAARAAIGQHGGQETHGIGAAGVSNCFDVSVLVNVNARADRDAF